MTLEKWLKENAVTQHDFARRCGVSQGTISRLLPQDGRLPLRHPSFDLAARIARETDNAVAIKDYFDLGQAADAASLAAPRRMYAIVFDFDTETLEQLYPKAPERDAYTDVRSYLTQRGFEWKQGSTYFGDDTVDAVRCVRTVQRLSAKYPWFKLSVRDIRMLRIEENNDLMVAIDDDDDDDA